MMGMACAPLALARLGSSCKKEVTAPASPSMAAVQTTIGAPLANRYLAIALCPVCEAAARADSSNFSHLMLSSSGCCPYSSFTLARLKCAEMTNCSTSSWGGDCVDICLFLSELSIDHLFLWMIPYLPDLFQVFRF